MRATITRGRKMPFLDTVANLLAVPNKLIFANADFESHDIDPEIEQTIDAFVARHELENVHVRLNEYAPMEELACLAANKRVNPFLRFTIGWLAWLAYLLNVGRLFGGDHYNPFSDSVNLFSNNRSIALHELGHVLDFRSRTYPGLYALIRLIPFVSLYQEYLASLYAVQFLREIGDLEEERRAYRLLFPAYSTYVFGALVEWFPSTVTRSLLLPVIIGGHITGEAVSRYLTPEEDVLGTRRGDIDRALVMFSPATETGSLNFWMGLGMFVGSSACGLLAPVGAVIGYWFARTKGKPVPTSPCGRGVTVGGVRS